MTSSFAFQILEMGLILTCMTADYGLLANDHHPRTVGTLGHNGIRAHSGHSLNELGDLMVVIIAYVRDIDLAHGRHPLLLISTARCIYYVSRKLLGTNTSGMAGHNPLQFPRVHHHCPVCNIQHITLAYPGIMNILSFGPA